MKYRCGICNGWKFVMKPDLKTADLCPACNGSGETDDPYKAYHSKVFQMNPEGKLVEFLTEWKAS